MSFKDYNPLPNSFFQPHPTQVYPMPQMPYPCPTEEMRLQMMCLYEQNRLLQQQYFHQAYQHMLQQQQWETVQNKIKIEEPARGVEPASFHVPNSETEKFVPHTEAVSKDLLRNRTHKIKKPKPQKNETKNIPKNYGKAIVSFIENNKDVVKAVLSKHSELSYISFMNLLRAKKNKINSIADLRNFWLEGEDKDFPKIVRILSNVFLRNFSLEYIFNSRISNYAGHVKYRGRLIEALRNPELFTSIKQY